MEEVKTEEKKYCVYMHVNKYNDKRYIGLTSQKPEWRWGTGGTEYLEQTEEGKYKQPAFAYALQKYDNWDEDWDHIIVASELTKDEAIQLEVELISFYQTNICKWGNEARGYNLTDGGDGATGHSHSEETKRKISEKAKGREFPEELKEKYSIIFSGDGNPFYGRHHTEETKKKLSEAAKEQFSTMGNPFLGKHHTDETKNFLSQKAKDRLSNEEEKQRLINIIKESMQRPDVREKLSIKQKERFANPENHPMYGKKHRDETKQKISEARKGKTISEETRQKISASQKGKKMSEESKAKIRESAINGSYNKRSVVQLTKDCILIQRYQSSAEAERQTGIKRDNIWRCCNLRNKTAGGYIWRYVEDWEEMQNAENMEC